MTFHSPSIWFLCLLLLVPFVAWRLISRRRSTAVPFSSTQPLAGIGSTWRMRFQWLPAALRVAAIVLLVVALARPQFGRRETKIDSEGIAIEMVIDRSGSMQAMDFEVDGQPVDRLTAVRDVASRFVAGDEELSGRTADLVGLISFAGYADSLTPLTLDHPYVVHALQQTEIVSDRSEDGTAIGDAVGLAIEKLQALEESREQSGSKPIESRVVILLTDGESNAGDIDPMQAAELAQSLGVKIYTIGVGTRGRAPVPVMDPFTGRQTLQWMDVNIDEETLQKIAETTGGRYFRATDTASLEAIYAEIDKLEKSHVEERQYVDYRELAVEPVYAGTLYLPPLALLAFLLLATEQLLANTVFRRIP